MDTPRYWGGDIPWVSSGEMKRRRLSSTSQTVTEQGAREGSKLVPERTVLAVVRGMSLAKEFRVAITQRPVTFNQDLKALIPSERLLPEFLFYYLLSQNGPIRDSASESGHGTKKLDTRVLEDWPLPLPPLPIQRKIAAILSAYDELIETHQRRIALLEKLAEEIYREWFVRLRFPGHEKVAIAKRIPSGWERVKVSSVTSFLKRGVAPIYDDEGASLAINQKCIRDGKLDMKHARSQSKEVPAERRIKLGDVLVNSTGEGTLGRVAQVLIQLDNCIVDSHVTIVRPKPDVPIHYFGMTLKAWEPHFSIMGQGSTNQTELAPALIGGVEIMMPTKDLQVAFEAQAEPLFAQITVLRTQTEHLTRTRDLLLPRLISGKLSVAELEIRFPPGMAEE